eukprot:195329-Prorocentrum_lima.AAC.1
MLGIAYKLWRTFTSPTSRNKTGGLLRVELVDCMAQEMSKTCTHFGCQTPIDIVARAMRELMPTQDLS